MQAAVTWLNDSVIPLPDHTRPRLFPDQKIRTDTV